ncbi:glycoside hydrolase family 2 [Salinilacihabitans rarus]|uniref:glycoside hydrolase family 2 n=1 Tax=Salinilacihabitans rarus TaxID=2961596 RepID=UPI0020C93729|nr:glycoside hydrolase family 2 [Salinilacihabitans rarus]
MAGKWTGGVVAASGDDDPPTVEEWVPVSAPGRASEFAAADDPIAYRVTFGDPRARADERAFIRLRGGYGRARVWINGVDRGEHDPGFVPARFEFDPAGGNELVVAPEDDGAAADPGARWEVDLDVRPPTFLESLAATPRLTDDGAVVDVDVTVDAGEGIDDTVTLSMRPEGFRGGASMDRIPVSAAAGERTTVSKRLDVRDPSLWWPRGYGPQHRYAIRAKLGEEAIERIVGLRTIERDADGFRVNGRRIRARGFARLPGGDPREDVRRAVEANATLLRVRGHVPSRELYAACDEAGVLVWQDLPAGGGRDADRGRELVDALVDEYRSHPSLAAVGVASDLVDPFETPLGGGLLSKLKFRYRAWRAEDERGDADAIAARVPDGIAAVPVAGPPGTGADATHLSLGWRYLDAADVDWLLERYPALGTVVGGLEAPSLSHDDADPGAVPGVDPAVFERRAGDAAASRRYQASTLKTVVEGLRRHGSGAVVGPALRDGSPDGGPGVLAADGSEKPSAAAVAAAYEPVQAVLDAPPAPGTVGLTLLNDGPREVEATVDWRAGGNEGAETVAVDVHGRASAGAVEIPRDADRVEVTVDVGDRTVRNRYRL